MEIVLFALGAALLSMAPTLAQHAPAAKIPAAAKATFAAGFATATAARWEKEGADYEGSFRQAGKKSAALITPTGQRKETETTLPVAQLPALMRTALARDYQGYRVGEAAIIVWADGRTVYEAELSRGGNKQDVLCTAEGTVIK